MFDSNQVLEGLSKLPTPYFLYDYNQLEETTNTFKKLQAPFGIEILYAMKANPLSSILKFMANQGFGIDAGSINECKRALQAGVPPQKIALTTQELPTVEEFHFLFDQGIHFNASSLNQLERAGQVRQGVALGIRINLGIASANHAKTATGGPASSFGMLNRLGQILSLKEQFNLNINTLHFHIGSGSDPKIQLLAVEQALIMIKQIPTITCLDIGGGFKVQRSPDESSTNIEEMIQSVGSLLEGFYTETGRKIKLIIEPGSALVQSSAVLVTTVIDKVQTSEYKFLKINSGMHHMPRTALYGAYHPISISQTTPSEETEEYVVVGSCCESADVFTTEADATTLQPRSLPKTQVGDKLMIHEVGVYASAMATNYISFQKPAEYLLRDGQIQIMRKPQALEDLYRDEQQLF